MMTLTQINSMGVMSNTKAGEDWMSKDVLYKQMNPQRCIICTFADQPLDIIEINEGYAHQTCLSDQYAEEEYRASEKGMLPEEDNYDQAREDKEASDEIRRNQHESSLYE